MKYDLVIAHRVCPNLAKYSIGFTNKFEMVKVTTVSLIKALKGIKTKFVVILDGCPQEYIKFFDDIFANLKDIDYERILTLSIGNIATYAKQFEILSSFTEQAEYLFFSEDDYIYKEYAFKAMMDFLKQPKVDFVTPLDHPDRYSHILPETLKVEIKASDYCHWREVGTTCCTFMMTSKTFVSSAKRIAVYGEGSNDVTLWLGLTKDCIFSPSATIGKAWRYIFMRKTVTGVGLLILKAWLWYKWRLPFGKKYHLWGPMPTLALHLSKPTIPPCSKDLKGYINYKDN